MDLAGQLRIQAHANRLANHRLLTAMAPLTHEQLHATRTSFFPTLIGTLNHILAVDQYYVGALAGKPELAELAKHWERYVAADELQPLGHAQRLSDQRLIDYCAGLDAAGCERRVEMPRRGGTVQRELAAHVLAHLFMHQTHHRGQVHAMLSGTSVTPPQLDEFLMPSEAHLREADMAALGWKEREVFGAAARP